MSYSNELNKYFNAYYKSYAGIELSLTKVKNHDFGFEEKIVKDSGTNEWNFKYCKSYECYFESTIKNRSKLLTDQPNSWDINNCSGDNAYNLPS